MSASGRYCPVCKQMLGAPLEGGRIAAHLDSVNRDECPMSRESYSLAGYGRPTTKVAVELRAADVRAALRLERLERLLAS